MKRKIILRSGNKPKKSGRHLFKPGNKFGKLATGPRKFTTLRQAFIDVFEMMGGAQGLYEFATRNQHNRKYFYGWIVKMLPREVSISDGGVEPNNLSNMKESELDDIITQHLAGK